ncbi:hypothetical protein FGO68_gene2334 [Halteria grandinella]|uniref:Uncharacterized protein n=1 Tax=Halteria grandinella TaxID=5974 RepID=A0A8J8NJ12_HALGN|nr:hypothetical protein FGO68_gene2334 [Halteria grandinella]
MHANRTLQTTIFGKPQLRNFRAAVILAGNGVYDGSEITEAVSMLIALSKHASEYKIFAPNIPQAHVVNHITGEEQKETRNVLVESARIARGNISDLKTLDSTQFDAILLPGGFGAAKNLSTFAFKGAEMTVNEDIQKVLQDFHKANKVIGLACISPVIAAKVFGTQSGGPGVTLTLGQKGEKWPYNGSIDAATSFGNTHKDTELGEVCVDEKNKIYTTPAYMKEDAKPHEIYQGMERLVREIAKAIKQ